MPKYQVPETRAELLDRHCTVPELANQKPAGGQVVREQIFALAYPCARRAARVRSAAAVKQKVILHAEEEDFEQQLLLGVWQTLGTYDSARSCLKTFIELIVASRSASLARSRRRQPKFEWLNDYHAVDVDNGVSAMERKVDVQRAIGSLAARDRELAGLLMFNGPGEASRILGVSRSRTYRAISRIRAAFAKAGLRPAPKANGRLRGTTTAVTPGRH